MKLSICNNLFDQSLVSFIMLIFLTLFIIRIQSSCKDFILLYFATMNKDYGYLGFQQAKESLKNPGKLPSAVWHGFIESVFPSTSIPFERKVPYNAVINIGKDIPALIAQVLCVVGSAEYFSSNPHVQEIALGVGILTHLTRTVSLKAISNRRYAK